MTASGIASATQVEHSSAPHRQGRPVVQRIVGSLVGVPAFVTIAAGWTADATDGPAGADEDQHEVVVRATVIRVVVTIKAPVEIAESLVRDELEGHRASARIQTFVPILTERAARPRLRECPPP